MRRLVVLALLGGCGEVASSAPVVAAPPPAAWRGPDVSLYLATTGAPSRLDAIGDVDGDGFDDVLLTLDVGLGQSTASQRLAGGLGGLQAAEVWPGTGGLMTVARGALTDLNGDGVDDVLLGMNDGGLPPAWSLVLGGDGPPPEPAWQSAPLPTTRVAVADTDLDGVAEALVPITGPCAAHYELVAGAVATVRDRTTPLSVPGVSPFTVPTDLQVGDLDGDGDTDLLAAIAHGWYAFRSGRSGLQSAPIWSYGPVEPAPAGAVAARAVVAPDLTGDGADDVILIDGDVWLVRGGAPFLGAPTLITHRLCSVRCPELDVVGLGDVDGDGVGDLALRDGLAVDLLLGGPAGPRWVTASYALPEAALALTVSRLGDVNGDGFADLGLLGYGVGARPYDTARYDHVGVVFGGPALDVDGDGALADDCDPARGDVAPGLPEVPGDGVDQDCSGVDDCLADLDGDGAWGSTVPRAPGAACAARVLTDCDDDSAAAHPGALEVAGNLVDEDCDGLVACRVDVDGDGVSTLADVAAASCAADASSAPGGDCDDADGTAFPGAVEQPEDEDDEDCDGVAWCLDDPDGDGASAVGAALHASSDARCDHAGLAVRSGDCAEGDASRGPGVDEIGADGVDQDCDGLDACWRDADGDGDGGAREDAAECEAGAASAGGDCDDADPTVGRTAPELPGDGVDQDCDGLERCFRPSADSDGWSADVDATVLVPALGPYTCRLDGRAAFGGDCNDADPAIHPGVVERPGRGDLDCDGVVRCAQDLDGDGYGGGLVPSNADPQCTVAPHTTDTRDCDDADRDVSPRGLEVTGNDRDENCDLWLTCWVDDDGDGAGVHSTRRTPASLGSCDVPGTASLPDDCDDADAARSPRWEERPGDGVDDDCDGFDPFAVRLEVARHGGDRWLRASVTGAVPGAVVGLFASLHGEGAGPCPPGLQGACFGLLDPVLVLRGVADVAGEAVLVRTLPPTIPIGAPIAAQAWMDAGWGPGFSPVVGTTAP